MRRPWRVRAEAKRGSDRQQTRLHAYRSVKVLVGSTAVASQAGSRHANQASRLRQGQGRLRKIAHAPFCVYALRQQRAEVDAETNPWSRNPGVARRHDGMSGARPAIADTLVCVGSKGRSPL